RAPHHHAVRGALDRSRPGSLACTDSDRHCHDRCRAESSGHGPFPISDAWLQFHRRGLSRATRSMGWQVPDTWRRIVKRSWVEWSWVGGVLLFLGAATAAAAGSVPRFDGRGWTIGNQEKNAKESLTEYVLPGQTVDGWQELVTSTVFFQPVPLGAFVD